MCQALISCSLIRLASWYYHDSTVSQVLGRAERLDQLSKVTQLEGKPGMHLHYALLPLGSGKTCKYIRPNISALAGSNIQCLQQTNDCFNTIKSNIIILNNFRAYGQKTLAFPFFHAYRQKLAVILSLVQLQLHTGHPSSVNLYSSFHLQKQEQDSLVKIFELFRFQGHIGETGVLFSLDSCNDDLHAHII